MYSERKKVWVLSCGVIFTCFIISLPVYARPQPEEGYVILPSFPELTIREYRAGEYKDYIIPRAQNSRIKINGKGILVLDSEFKLDDNCDADIILISQGWHGNPKELLTLNNHDINIIIHPSVRRVRELEILEQLNDNQYKSHSLRHKGFFKI